MKKFSDIINENESKGDSEKLERAKHVDLITLPESIKGTNCGNCKFFNKEKQYCDNHEVNQPVHSNMCCKEWDAEGVKRAWIHE
jgi:hypothetical protein